MIIGGLSVRSRSSLFKITTLYSTENSEEPKRPFGDDFVLKIFNLRQRNLNADWYVQKASGGVASKIQSAGMSIRAIATPITGLPQVGNLSVSAGDGDGEVDGNFDAVRGSKSYEVESSLDPITTGGWTHRAILTASKFTIADLTSGTRLWFRVRAIGPNNIKGAWSDPAVKVVP